MYVMLVGFLVLNTYHARVRYRFDKMTGLTKWYKLRRKGGGFTTQIQSLICGRLTVEIQFSEILSLTVEFN